MWNASLFWGFIKRDSWGLLNLMYFVAGVPGFIDDLGLWGRWLTWMPWWLRIMLWAISILLAAIWIVSRIDHWLEERNAPIRLGVAVGPRLRGNADEYPEGPVTTEIRQLALNGDIVLSGKKNPNEKILHKIPQEEWASMQLDVFKLLAGSESIIDTEANQNGMWYDLHIRRGDCYKLRKKWWWT